MITATQFLESISEATLFQLTAGKPYVFSIGDAVLAIQLPDETFVDITLDAEVSGVGVVDIPLPGVIRITPSGATVVSFVEAP